MIKARLINKWAGEVGYEKSKQQEGIRSINTSIKILTGAKHCVARSSLKLEKNDIQTELRELEELENLIEKARYE